MASSAPRWIAALVTGLGTALIMYGVFLSRGKPFPLHRVGDAELAYRFIPLELFIGLVVGLAVFRLFGQRQRQAPRADTQERMVYRFAYRRGGHFTLKELEDASPLSPPQAREAVQSLLQAGKLRLEAGTYYISAGGPREE